MSEMVERAARAIHKALDEEAGVSLSEAEATAAAFAAIATMRVPTEAMLGLMCDALPAGASASERDLLLTWQAAIDTALAPAPEGTGTGEMG